MMANDAMRLKELDKENTQLKRTVANRACDTTGLQPWFSPTSWRSV